MNPAESPVAAPPAPEPLVLAGAKKAPAKWQDALVVGVLTETSDAVTLRLQLPGPVGFLPGQYYNVRLAVPGRDTLIQRAYSVASSPEPDPSVIDIGIREVPGGLVSPRLVHELSVGDAVSVRGPYGRFTWTEHDAGPVLLVGAGSGIVPLVSIVRYGAARGISVPMRLVASSGTAADALYASLLAQLEERHAWFEVTQTVTRDPTDARARHHRRIDLAMLAEAIEGQAPGSAYVCGPPAMVEAVQEWLGELGVAPGAIRVEKYD